MYLHYRTTISRVASAINHIETAIELLYRGNLDCAISLAVSVGEMLPPSEVLYSASPMKLDSSQIIAVDWLKNDGCLRQIEMTEFDAVVVIVRVINALVAAYGQTSDKVDEFMRWVKETE